MLFISPQKLFSFSRYLNFCLEYILVMQKNNFVKDKKDQNNFKIYDVTAWEANNCNTHIALYLKKQRQSDNEIWSVNTIQHENIFLEKSYKSCGEETSRTPFSKKSKLSVFLDLKFLHSLFLLYAKLRAIKIY